jgi:hypothetical protein
VIIIILRIIIHYMILYINLHQLSCINICLHIYEKVYEPDKSSYLDKCIKISKMNVIFILHFILFKINYMFHKKNQ